MRSAIAFAQLTSARGRCKVVVIFPADRMNPVAANALLKTLEEPPGLARFVTLNQAPRNRCHQQCAVDASLCISPVPEKDVASRWLIAQGVDEPEVVLSVAGGQPLEALAWIRDGVDASTLSNLPLRVMAGMRARSQTGRCRVSSTRCRSSAMTNRNAGRRADSLFSSPVDGAGANVPALHDWARALAGARSPCRASTECWPVDRIARIAGSISLRG